MQPYKNRFSIATHVTIEMNHPNKQFRIDISIIDYKHGEKPDWEIIRESARVLKRYTQPHDEFTVCIVNYNGLFAGEVTFDVRKNIILWWSKNSINGMEIYNV